MPISPKRVLELNAGRYSSFIEYVLKRLNVQICKDRGDPPPWSNDPILQEHKFCCVLRDDDRTSREARARIMALPDSTDRLAAALSFRLYNRVSTLDHLILNDGLRLTNGPAILALLNQLSPVLNATAYKIQVRGGGLWELKSIANSIGVMHGAAMDNWQPSPSARVTCLRMHKELDVGGFVAYQIMQDLRWIFGPYEDEGDWCLVGPGAHRGLKRLAGTYKPSHWEDRGKDKALIGSDLRIHPSYKEPLRELLRLCRGVRADITLFDVQHNLCEWDKHARISSKEGTGRKYKGGK